MNTRVLIFQILIAYVHLWEVLAILIQRHFHRADGLGYALLGDLLIKLNAINPQNASRMLTPFMSWKRYDSQRAQAMKQQLERLANLDGLSDDLFEKVEKALA